MQVTFRKQIDLLVLKKNGEKGKMVQTVSKETRRRLFCEIYKILQYL